MGPSATDAAHETTDACGALGQMCCAEYACDDGLGCIGISLTPPSLHTCDHCGYKDGPCCHARPFCAEGLACGVDLGLGTTDERCHDIPDGASCITSCEQPGGQYCGPIGNGCGKLVECGECARPGFTCGGSGIHSVCGAAPDSGACAPTKCEAPNGRYCGLIGDGCGSVVDCGSCGEGVMCGGSGVPNLCDDSRDGDSPRKPPPPLPPEEPPPPNMR
jgi:hypothetical protein